MEDAPREWHGAKLPALGERGTTGDVFRLIRFAFWLAACFALVYFAATVPLGSRTLIGHLRAIAATPAAHDLARGTEEKAGDLAEKVKQELSDDPAASPQSPPAAQADEMKRGAHEGPAQRRTDHRTDHQTDHRTDHRTER